MTRSSIGMTVGVVVWALAALRVPVRGAAGAPPQADPVVADVHRATLTRYCVTCHNSGSRPPAWRSTALARCGRRRPPPRGLGKGRPQASQRRHAARRPAPAADAISWRRSGPGSKATLDRAAAVRPDPGGPPASTV